jgi:hypothetical protein
MKHEDNEMHRMKCIECGEWRASLFIVRDEDHKWERRYSVRCFNGHGMKEDSHKTEAEAWDAYFEKNLGLTKP